MAAFRDDANLKEWRQNHSKMAAFKDGANEKKAPENQKTLAHNRNKYFMT